MPEPAMHEPKSAGREALSIIVFSGDFERIHYALALASAAAAIGKPVTILFTGEGVRALTKPTLDGAPGWRALKAGGGGGGGETDDGYRARGVAGMEELLIACVEMGVRMIVCEMGLRVARLERSALRDDIPIEEGGLVTFLGATPAGGTLTFV